MRTAERLCVVMMGLVGGGAVYLALRLPYWSQYGPGPGFLPVWMGSALFVLSALLWVELWRQEKTSGGGQADARLQEESDKDVPSSHVASGCAVRKALGAHDGDGRARIRTDLVASILAILGHLLLIKPLGWLSAAALFLLVGCRYIAGLSWGKSVLYAVLGPAALYIVFAILLAMPFPQGPLGF